MKTTIEELDELIVITMAGSLDTLAAIEVEQTLKPITASEEAKDIVFECIDLVPYHAQKALLWPWTPSLLRCRLCGRYSLL